MNGVNFAEYIRLRTKTDSTSFPNDDIVTYANVELENLARKIEIKKKDFFLMPATTNLLAGQREYKLPQDMLSSIQYVELLLDGVNYTRAREFNLNSFREECYG